MSHDHSCHCHKEERKYDKIKIIIGVFLFVVALAFDFAPIMEFAIFFASYILIGGEVLLRAFDNIAHFRQKGFSLFDEHFLMSIATLGAFGIGEYPEGVAVMLFYQIGESLQDRALGKSERSISALLDIKPDFANLKVGKKIIKTESENIKKGDIIVVKAGERVPSDGTVLGGVSYLDTSAISGESIPKEVKTGDKIFSGSINQNGLLSVRITSDFKDSTVSKIVEFVRNASGAKAKTERFITKFAKIYTPIVVFAALFLAFVPPLFLENAAFNEWFYKALVFLVISCPCALVISIPLSFFAGLGRASKEGILIKGGGYLEALGGVDTVVFDKTGTLTEGKFEVCEIAPTKSFTKDELLFFAALAESFSNHPIAISIVKAYAKAIEYSVITAHKELFGLGVRAMIGGKTVLVGNEKLMNSHNIACEYIDESAVHIAVEGVYAGYITLSDKIKQDSKQTIDGLRELGVKNIAILTGDSAKIGEKVAKELGISEVFAELLPLEKQEKLELLSQKTRQSGANFVFVGDGVNDAPSLVTADIGVAMSMNDTAVQAADVVLMRNEPSKLVNAIKIAKKTKRIAWQNISFALGVKAVLLMLGVMGVSGMWEAVFGDVGVTMIAVLNAGRILRG